MADVLCSIEEAREAGTLQVFEKKTKYHEYKFLVRSEEEIKFNVSQNISMKPTGGEYFKPLFLPKHNSNIFSINSKYLRLNSFLYFLVS